MNLKDKKKELEDAGYTISKSGKNVLKDGKSVAGINPEGNLWSGSSKVRGILKGSKPKAKSKPRVSVSKSKTTSPKTKPKGSGSSSPSTTALKKPPRVTTTKLPKAGKPSGGRGKGENEVLRRRVDKALDKSSSSSTTKKPKTTKTKRTSSTKPMVVKGSLTSGFPNAKKYTKAQWQKMTRKERKESGLPTSVLGATGLKWKS